MEKRSASRKPAEYLPESWLQVKVKIPGRGETFALDLNDLSEAGMAFTAGEGQVPLSPLDAVEITTPDGSELKGQVLYVRDKPIRLTRFGIGLPAPVKALAELIRSPKTESSYVRTITYQGKNVIISDFSGANGPELAKRIEAAKKIIHASPPYSALSITDCTGARPSKENFDLLLPFVKSNQPYMLASTTVGIEGATKFLLNLMVRVSNRNIRAFSTYEEAKDWLVSERFSVTESLTLE